MSDESKPPNKPESNEEPQVFAVNRSANKVRFTRRNFVELTAAVTAAAALASQANANTAADSSEAIEAAATATPKAIGDAVVTPSSVNFRSGPGTSFGVVAILKKGDKISVFAKNKNGSWLEGRVKSKVGWIAKSTVTFTFSLDSVPVEKKIPTPPPGSAGTGSKPTQPPAAPTATPVPPGQPGEVPAGENGIAYQQFGQTFHLPCGSPIPEGAVCTCNCVSMPAANTCTCDVVCTCDTVCSCVGESHYWYPN